MKKEARSIAYAFAVTLLVSVPVYFYLFPHHLQQEKIFFAPQPNTSPLFEPFEREIVACEGDAFSIYFNASDLEGDVLSFDIQPKHKDPFFVRKLETITADNQNCVVEKLRTPCPAITQGELFSKTLTKNHVNRRFKERIAVTDGQTADIIDAIVTVVEINNPPVFERIGVQTIDLSTAETTFVKQVQVNDVEDGNQNAGKLIFDLTFSSDITLFGISSTGVMNFTPTAEHSGNHLIKLCAKDSGLETIHDAIVQCKNDGTPQRTCEIFQLTVTDKNRYPTILAHYPQNVRTNVSGKEPVFFNISNFDPDGTIPDVSWYVDNALQKRDPQSAVSDFTHTFGCGVFGDHKVKAEITDGILTDTVEWNITVVKVPCAFGEHYGSLGESFCQEKWACEDWDLCQHAAQSHDLGLLTLSDYNHIVEACTQNQWSEAVCGFHLRDCFDVNDCNTTSNAPQEIQACYFVLGPSCHDGFKNCHDGSCEFLVDCGGPCQDCTTCSDRLQNQEEEGIDCGGTCHNSCPAKKSVLYLVLEKKIVKYLLVFVFFVAIFILVIQIFQIIETRKKLYPLDQNEDDVKNEERHSD